MVTPLYNNMINSIIITNNITDNNNKEVKKYVSYSFFGAMSISTQIKRDVIVNFENTRTHKSMKEKSSRKRKQNTQN